MDAATIISLTTSAIFAIWIFYNSKFWPARQKEREQGQEFDRKTRGDALTQVLDANKALIDNLIERSKVEYKIDAAESNLLNQLETLKRETEEVRRGIARLENRAQFEAKDRERMDEILEDVDTMFHEIKAMILVKFEGGK